MSDLIRELQNTDDCYCGSQVIDGELKLVACLFHKAAGALEQANARERKAFEAGWTMYADSGCTDRLATDMEQAWQHHQCQDDTDWKVVDEDRAKAIDAAALGTAEDSGNE